MFRDVTGTDLLLFEDYGHDFSGRHTGGCGWRSFLAPREYLGRLLCSSPGPSVSFFSMSPPATPVWARSFSLERGLARVSVSSYMLTLIDGAQTWAETLATRPDEERLKQVR